MAGTKNLLILAGILVCIGTGCKGKDEASGAKNVDVQKVMQEAAQKEQKMYEGVQKGIGEIENNIQEQKDKEKK
jgi:hypothetical protein